MTTKLARSDPNSFRLAHCVPQVAAVWLGVPLAMVPTVAFSQQIQPPQLTPQTMIESAHRLSETIRQVVGRRLAEEPIPPAAAFALQSVAAAERIDPTAILDGGEGEAFTYGLNENPPLWNVWVDVTTGFTEDDHPVTGFEGPLTTASVGGDRKIGDRAVLGLIANFETSEFDTVAGPGRRESEAIGVGGYAGLAITDQLVADASVLWKDVDNFTAFGPVGASYDSERWQAAANLTGYFYSGTWRFSPKGGVAWSREDQEAYADPTLTIGAPDQRITTTTLSAGIDIGHTFALANGNSVEPWLGAAVEWNNVDLDPSPPAGAPSSDDEFGDVRLSGGINANFGERLSVALKGDVSGLARDDFIAATVGGQVALRF